MRNRRRTKLPGRFKEKFQAVKLRSKPLQEWKLKYFKVPWKKNRLNSKTHETHLPKIMENVHDLEFFPSIFRLATNTIASNFHTTTIAFNIFMMLIKRVKLLRVLHSFPFYFVYFLDANIVKNKTHTDMSTSAHSQEQQHKEGTDEEKSVSNIFQSLEARFSQSYSGHFFSPPFIRTLLTIMTSVYGMKIDFFLLPLCRFLVAEGTKRFVVTLCR